MPSLIVGLKDLQVRLVSLGKATKSTQWIAGFRDKIRIQDLLNMKQYCYPLKHDHRLSYLVLDICGRTQLERKIWGEVLPVSLHVAYLYSTLQWKYLLEFAWSS
jgi:hypothetical protein